MILTHVFSRITCRWTWTWLSTPAWSAMAHYKAIAVMACAGIGWITYGHLPDLPSPPDLGRLWPAPAAAPVNVPEPLSVAVFGVGLAGLLRARRSGATGVRAESVKKA